MDIQNILRELQELKKRDREILALQKIVKQLEMKNNIQQKEEFALMRANNAREDMQVRTIYELETTDNPSLSNDFIEIGQPDRERKILLSNLLKPVTDSLDQFIGTVHMFAFDPNNKGLSQFLKCSGEEYLKEDYPKLAEFLGNTWGNPSSIDKFKVPNLNNWFIRANAGAVGRQQQDALQDHTHSYRSSFYTPKADGMDTGNYDFNRNVLQNTSNVQGARTDTETRPKNISLDFWIRAY